MANKRFPVDYWRGFVEGFENGHRLALLGVTVGAMVGTGKNKEAQEIAMSTKKEVKK